MVGKRREHKQQHDAVRKLKKTNKYAYLFVPLLLMLADYLAVLCAEELSFALRNYFIRNHGILRITKFHFYVIAPVIYIVYLQLCNLYMQKKPVLADHCRHFQGQPVCHPNRHFHPVCGTKGCHYITTVYGAVMGLWFFLYYSLPFYPEVSF